jgi:mono/diheme cytochrome c family protein
MKSSQTAFQNLAIALYVAIAFLSAGYMRAQSPSTGLGDRQLPTLIRSTKGQDLYRAYCASCHGLDAKGDGPAAAALRTKVPNLTALTKRNGGMFPSAKVRKVISGDDVISSHGSREMPIWGPIFHQVEEDVDRGNVRLDNLVKYLESIQGPN